MYKKESHIRSLLKGISWRIIATADTVLVVLLVTSFFGEANLQHAISIGFFEFFIKLFIYYLHERIWQQVRKGAVTVKQTVYKSISWRFFATTTTFIISGMVLESFNEIALFIALTELFTKFALYYFHERLWLKIPLGRIRNYIRQFFKK